MFGTCVCYLLLISMTNLVIGAPESLKDFKTNKLEQQKILKKLQTRSGKAYPCPHHQQDNIYALIQGQSEGRIVNKPNYQNHNLETAASNSLAQTVTLNSQISVGSNGGGVNGLTAPPPPPPTPNQQYLPSVGRPPIFNDNNNNNGYLPPPPAPAPPTTTHFNNPNLNRPFHYETQQNGYASAFNRFSNSQANFQQQNQYQQQHQQQHQHQPQQNSFNYRPTQQFVENKQFSGNSYAGSFSHQSHGTQQQNFHTNNIQTVPSVAQNSIDGQLNHIIQNTFSQASLDPTAEKHIYVHVPPEDLEEKSVHQSQVFQQPPPPQKHYKIIFIKAPTYNQPNVAQLAAASAQQTEEKTLIYVLVKKPEEPSVEELQQIQEASYKHHKPEVYFIKYKTRKEGEDFQNQIIQQQGTSDYGVGDGEVNGSGIDIRLNNGESSSSASASTSSSSSVSTSSSYATSAVSTPTSYLPPDFLSGVPLE